MKTCSYCGYQNEDADTLCRGCGESLKQPAVQNEAADLKDPATAPVVVATFHSLEEAELLKSELEAVGIEAYIPEEYTTGVFSSITPFQKVTVRVPAGQLEAARGIVSAFAASSRVETGAEDESRGGASTDEPPAAESSTHCPPGTTHCVSCGAPIPLDSILCPKCGWTQPRLA